MNRILTFALTSRALWLCLLIIPAGGCFKATKPDLPQIFPAALRPTGKRPLIIIPGILGSELRNRRTGERVWPEVFESEDDTLALPISAADPAENRDEIIATEVIITAQFAKFVPQIGVYDKLLEALERYGGYRRGDLEAPPAGGDQDTYYLFAYDWRRDNVETARLLAHKLAALKRKLGRPDLRFDIIAHSMGGLAARYYAMYGERDALAEAEPQPDWSGAQHLGRLIMIGTPNAGSLDALRSLLRGYSITETNRPRLRLFSSLGREVIFTAPSVYQLLPRNGAARFLNARLSPLSLDLFDVATWRRLEWAIAFEPDFLKREQRALVKRLGSAGGSAEAERLLASREQFLRRMLKRAAAFHRALDAAGAPPEELGLHLFGGDCEPTLAAAMIATVKGKQRTLFSHRNAPGGRKARQLAYQAMFAPGDGRVTRQSLFGLALAPETDEPIRRWMKQPAVHTIFSCELHGDLPLNLTLQDNLLTILLGQGY